MLAADGCLTSLLCNCVAKEKFRVRDMAALVRRAETKVI